MAPHDLASADGPPADRPCARHNALDSLLVRVGEGDRDAFAAFYDEMSQNVYGMSLASGHGPALSAQVTLDVFLQAWQQASGYDPQTGSAWTWVRTIALEEISNQLEMTRPHPAARSRTPEAHHV